MRPQTIQIYLPSGDPAGIRIAEITTRTVRIFEVPRSLMAEFRKRPESKQVGVTFCSVHLRRVGHPPTSARPVTRLTGSRSTSRRRISGTGRSSRCR